jgi:hypothetical protein
MRLSRSVTSIFRPGRAQIVAVTAGRAFSKRRTGRGMPETIQILDVNTKLAVGPLQGQTDRADLQRTGMFFGKGVATKSSVKWTFTPAP